MSQRLTDHSLPVRDPSVSYGTHSKGVKVPAWYSQTLIQTLIRANQKDKGEWNKMTVGQTDWCDASQILLALATCKNSLLLNFFCPQISIWLPCHGYFPSSPPQSANTLFPFLFLSLLSDQSIKWRLDCWRLHPCCVQLHSTWLLPGTSSYCTHRKRHRSAQVPLMLNAHTPSAPLSRSGFVLLVFVCSSQWCAYF